MNIDIQDTLRGGPHLKRSPEAAVAVVGLAVSRGGRPVLHGLDFKVARGRITELLGPNGCGKTTLMRAIVGVQIVESATCACSASRRDLRPCGRGSAT
jgi:ABC-type Mn2+/Zn2+ transport system ATPase subunit